ncbi:peptidoglycan-binding domain-containing protein [Aquisphaera insulae]|uniref:peptidoglycan-binding domain-containing protein n=1 Tax=Aquisphaera insulae TaxID=2712864 RepID=UPI0013ED2F2E|nr:peptidoglycan-binding domain-containing protein [Aquisphaera insulae]
MALKSDLLRGNARLEQASQGPPSIKPQPAIEDPDAITRIQYALKQLGYLPKTLGTTDDFGDKIGIFGPVTTAAVKAFQMAAFPGVPSEWDGKVGKGTLAKLDARLSDPGPQPGPTGDSIEQTMDGVPAIYPYDVVDPTTVSSDPRRQGGLRSTTINRPFILLVFKITRGGKRYWIQAVAPPDLRQFDSAHVFFHPNPGFAGLDDRDYDENQGRWNTVFRYGPWMGSQSVAAGRKQVLFVPIMSNAQYMNLGFLGDDPIARLNELLLEVQKWVNPYDPNTPQLANLGASSFSFGISPLAMFLGKVGGSGLLREVFDFDSLFSNSPYRLMAGAGNANFKKYAQNWIAGMMMGRSFILPVNCWGTYTPPLKTPGDVHAHMPDLLYHALSS